MHKPSGQALMFRHFKPMWTRSAKNSSDSLLDVPVRAIPADQVHCPLNMTVSLHTGTHVQMLNIDVDHAIIWQHMST
eukprot:1071916-Prorocentrum_lima.AAC.1